MTHRAGELNREYDAVPMDPVNAPLLEDPIGLVARSPELAELARTNPKLRRAIERGRPFDAYRALYWGSVFRRFKGDDAATAEALLGHRRIFFKPLKRAPTMLTMNGFGTSLYGASDHDSNDGTYVATFFAVFIFVPVFPIGSYLVRDARGSRRRAWSFMAKVPLSAVMHLWQRSIALALLALVGFGVFHALDGYSNGVVHVVNALDRAVAVDLSGHARVVVPAGGNVAIKVPVGPHAIGIFDGDRSIEAGSFEVPRGQSAVVWNVLGAAPVYVEQVIYSAKKADSPSGDLHLFCGESSIVKYAIDYPFEDPPTSLEVPKGRGSVSKTIMAVAPGGTATCTKYLGAHGEITTAARIALRVASATMAPAARLGEDIEGLVQVAPRGEAEAFVKALVARDDSLAAHRIYQDWLLATDQQARAVAEYAARLAAHPDDPDADYLALRLREDDDLRPIVDAAVARHPNHGYLRHLQIYTHASLRDFVPVVAAAEVLHGIDLHLWARDMDLHAAALVVLGRATDAVTLLKGGAGDGALEPSDAMRAKFLACRVEHGAKLPEDPLPSGPDATDASLVLARLTTGVDVDSSEIDGIDSGDARMTARIAKATLTSPDTALRSAAEAKPDVLSELPSIVSVLLIAEAARVNAAPDLIARLNGATFPKRIVDAVGIYVRTGKMDNDLRGLSLEVQAALDFVRSRAFGLSASERSALVARAKQADPFRGPVSVAITSWPS